MVHRRAASPSSPGRDVSHAHGGRVTPDDDEWSSESSVQEEVEDANFTKSENAVLSVESPKMQFAVQCAEPRMFFKRRSNSPIIHPNAYKQGAQKARKLVLVY